MLNVKRAQWALGLVLGLMAGVVLSQETSKKKSSYAPVVIDKDFATTMAEMKQPNRTWRSGIWHCSKSGTS